MKRILNLVLGQLVIALGISMVINAQLGCFTITMTNLSLSNLTGLSFGFCSMVVELIVIICCLLMKSKIGVATLFNGLLGGYFIDFVLTFLPLPSNFFIKLAYVIIGCFVFVFGCYLQGQARLGKTSSNLLTACLRKRFGLSITTMKVIQESLFLIIGLLGASSSFGLATVILVLFFGAIMDKCYKLLKYDPTKVKHQYIELPKRKTLKEIIIEG